MRKITNKSFTTPYVIPFCTLHTYYPAHCTALYCTDLHCTELYCTELYCTALHCTLNSTKLHSFSFSGFFCGAGKCYSATKVIFHFTHCMVQCNSLYTALHCRVNFTVHCTALSGNFTLHCTVLYSELHCSPHCTVQYGAL